VFRGVGCDGVAMVCWWGGGGWGVWGVCGGGLVRCSGVEGQCSVLLGSFIVPFWFSCSALCFALCLFCLVPVFVCFVAAVFVLLFDWFLFCFLDISQNQWKLTGSAACSKVINGVGGGPQRVPATVKSNRSFPVPPVHGGVQPGDRTSFPASPLSVLIPIPPGDVFATGCDPGKCLIG